MSNAINLEDVIEDISRVMDENGLTPDDITVTKYTKAGGLFDGRRLRKFGGFAAIVDEAFRQDKDRDFYTSRALARKRNYVAQLERKLADREFERRQFLDGLDVVYNRYGPIATTKMPLKKPLVPKTKAGLRENVVNLSDLHLGLDIDREEILTNGYSWTIGARRLGKMAMQVASFKEDHRNECPQLRVCIGGDIGQGIIHLNDSGTDLITHQTYGITSYMVQLIDYWRNFYERIVVEVTPDNHMRLVHKGEGRSASQKYDSHATMGFVLGLQAAFRTMPDVEFHVPKSAITTFDVLGHKFGLTHGDTHVTSGNVGSQVNVKAISTQILKLNASVMDGVHYDAMLMGHVHVPLYMHINETNTRLIINGTGSGTDGYSQGVGFFRTMPTQVMFEATVDRAVGDFRIVDLDDADDDGAYDRIIKPYQRQIQFNQLF